MLKGIIGSGTLPLVYAKEGESCVVHVRVFTNLRRLENPPATTWDFVAKFH